MIEIPRITGDFGKREKSAYKVRLLGLGGAGLNIMSRVASEGGDSKLMTVLDTDMRALKSSRAAVRLQLGGEVTHGMGCGGDPDLGRESAEMSEGQIREILRGSDLVFLCVGLGGGTGSGAGPVIARIAQEEQCFVIAAVTLPFHFEGRRRQQQALDSLTDLRRSVGALLTFENDRMGDLIVPSSGVQEAFAAADRMISQSVRAITVLLDRPGMIRVTLEDLLGFLNGKDVKCTFGFGDAEGAGRAERATAEALQHHLKEHTAGLAEAQSVLIHLAGDSSVTFAEVEQVAAAVAEKTSQDCKVLLGVSTSQDLEKKLSVAIIASVDQNRRHPARLETEPSGQELHVTRLVDLPPLVRPAPVPAAAPAPAPARPTPKPAPVTMGNADAPGTRTNPSADPASLKLAIGSKDAADSAHAMGRVSSPLQPLPGSPSLPFPPPSPAPLPSGPLKASPFGGMPAPVPEKMPGAGTPARERELPEVLKSPAPLASAPPLAGLGDALFGATAPAAPAGSVPPATSQAPEAARPFRGTGSGSLGDPLDYPSGKGRFEGTEPTVIHGVDLDWPTFLRKKRSAQG